MSHYLGHAQPLQQRSMGSHHDRSPRCMVIALFRFRGLSMVSVHVGRVIFAPHVNVDCIARQLVAVNYWWNSGRLSWPSSLPCPPSVHVVSVTVVNHRTSSAAMSLKTLLVVCFIALIAHSASQDTQTHTQGTVASQPQPPAAPPCCHVVLSFRPVSHCTVLHRWWCAGRSGAPLVVGRVGRVRSGGGGGGPVQRNGGRRRHARMQPSPFLCAAHAEAFPPLHLHAVTGANRTCAARPPSFRNARDGDGIGWRQAAGAQPQQPRSNSSCSSVHFLRQFLQSILAQCGAGAVSDGMPLLCGVCFGCGVISGRERDQQAEGPC